MTTWIEYLIHSSLWWTVEMLIFHVFIFLKQSRKQELLLIHGSLQCYNTIRNLHKAKVDSRDRKGKRICMQTIQILSNFLHCAHKDLSQEKKKKKTPIFFIPSFILHWLKQEVNVSDRYLVGKYFVNVCIIFSSEESELFQGTRADSTDHKLMKSHCIVQKDTKRPKHEQFHPTPHNSAFSWGFISSMWSNSNWRLAGKFCSLMVPS